jgi:hypothetical protein
LLSARKRMVTRRWLLALVSLVAGVLAIGVAGQASGVAARSSAGACKSPTAQPPNRGTGNNVLNGVAAASRCKAWAVGYYRTDGVSRTLIEHWDGKAWKVPKTPNPGRSGDGLKGVAWASTTNVWTVGYYLSGRYPHPRRTLILHGNGKSWKMQRSPNPSRSWNELYGVDAVSPTNVWAVGAFRGHGGHYEPLIEHWNGKEWKVQPSPHQIANAETSSLAGVAAISSTSAWAVGVACFCGLTSLPQHYTVVEHWNGKRWKVKQPREPGGDHCPTGLNGVAATSSANAWAVGYSDVCISYDPQSSRNLIEHWNGKAWRVQRSPNPGRHNGFTPLNGVAATSATNAWAVGSYNNGTTVQPLVLHWNGTAWRVKPTTNPDGFTAERLKGVAATSRTNAWAVGSYNNGTTDQALALHWNGHAWRP